MKRGRGRAGKKKNTETMSATKEQEPHKEENKWGGGCEDKVKEGTGYLEEEGRVIGGVLESESRIYLPRKKGNKPTYIVASPTIPNVNPNARKETGWITRRWWHVVHISFLYQEKK